MLHFLKIVRYCLKKIIDLPKKYTIGLSSLDSILPIIYGIAITAVGEVSFPEKNDTKISNFGSVVCFLGHIL